jgi:hypothetical protein
MGARDAHGEHEVGRIRIRTNQRAHRRLLDLPIQSRLGGVQGVDYGEA